MAYLLIWQGKKTSLQFCLFGLFCTIVSEVSFFVSNSVLSTVQICIHWNWKFLIDMEKAREMHMLKKLLKTKYGEKLLRRLCSDLHLLFKCNSK